MPNMPFAKGLRHSLLELASSMVGMWRMVGVGYRRWELTFCGFLQGYQSQKTVLEYLGESPIRGLLPLTLSIPSKNVTVYRWKK